MKAKNISDITLEKYLLREIPEKQIAQIDRLIHSDDDIRQRLVKLQQSNITIAEKYPSNEITKEIINRYNTAKNLNIIKDSRKSYYKKFLYPSLAIAAAVIIMFIFPALFNTNISIHENKEITRIKGMQTKLFIYRKKNNSAELLQNGSFARQGDLLQIAFTSSDAYAAILSFDGRGTITMHYPKSLNFSTKIKPDKKILLPESYELDDAPRFERFFLLTSKSPFDADAIAQAAEAFANDIKRSATENIPLEETINQLSIILIKGVSL